MRSEVMHHLSRSSQILLVTLMLACILFLFTHTGCDPTIQLRVGNQSDSNITLFINESASGTVKAMEQKTFSTVEIPYHPDAYWAPEDYLIEAKTSEGKVLYSKRFTWQELDDMDWKIVIPPDQDK